LSLSHITNYRTQVRLPDQQKLLGFFIFISYIIEKMSTVRFIADLHFGHENMARHRGFASAAEQDEYIVSQWNGTVHKRDITYILGDVTMEKANYDILDRLNGRKHVVLGNHDKLAHTAKLMQHVDSVAGMIQYKGLFLTHCPIHTMELDYRVKYNIHGHIHEKYVERDFKMFGITFFKRIDRRYICVSCEQVNYTPKTLKELGINR
jgi:calcineurin-like phosphoesterase family protein